ncbi:hypothetical protein C8F01DRAFT_1301282 [Mycena amicta]|nr:hypothetical protein C8F01DRAFT_1301282 [Mycena amicta]
MHHADMAADDKVLRRSAWSRRIFPRSSRGCEHLQHRILPSRPRRKPRVVQCRPAPPSPKLPQLVRPSIFGTIPRGSYTCTIQAGYTDPAQDVRMSMGSGARIRRASRAIDDEWSHRLGCFQRSRRCRFTISFPHTDLVRQATQAPPLWQLRYPAVAALRLQTPSPLSFCILLRQLHCHLPHAKSQNMDLRSVGTDYRPGTSIDLLGFGAALVTPSSGKRPIHTCDDADYFGN